MNFQSISVWCVCKLCRASFQKIEEFLKHKFEKHLIELQSMKCIILEEAKYDQENEQYHDFTFQQARSPPSQNIIIDDHVAIIVPTKTTPKPLPVKVIKDEPHCSSNDPNPEDSEIIANSNNKLCYSPSPSPAPVIKTETSVIFQDNTEDSDGENADSSPVLHHSPQGPPIKEEWVDEEMAEMEEASSTNDDNLLYIKSEATTDPDLDPESSDFSHNVDVDIDSNFNDHHHLPQPKTELKDCHGQSDKDRRISIESSPTTTTKPKPNTNTRVTSSEVKNLINNSLFDCKLCGKQFDREPEFKIHATICQLYNNKNNNNMYKQMGPTSKETGTGEVRATKIQSCFTTSQNEKDRQRDRDGQEHPDTDEPMIFNPYGCPTSDLKSIYFTKTKTGSIAKSKKSKTPTTGTGNGRGLMQRKVRQKGRLWIPPVLENPLELQYSLPCLT